MSICKCEKLLVRHISVAIKEALDEAATEIRKDAGRMVVEKHYSGASVSYATIVGMHQAAGVVDALAYRLAKESMEDDG